MEGVKNCNLIKETHVQKPVMRVEHLQGTPPDGWSLEYEGSSRTNCT